MRKPTKKDLLLEICKEAYPDNEYLMWKWCYRLRNKMTANFS